MDPLFNSFIPKSISSIHIIHPAGTLFRFIAIGKTFVTGLASRFDTTYSPCLAPYLSEDEYESLIERINDTLYSNWPCTLCQLLGYVLCPCTLGLSFVCPGLSVGDAREAVEKEIHSVNKWLRKRKCFMVL